MTEACAELESHGFTLFVIDRPMDTQEFFAQAKAAFPFDPTISGDVHWDAFADSLWGGLDACQYWKIAIVIQDATAFRKARRRDYDIAITCLTEVAKDVEAEKHVNGHEEAEIVVLVGIN